ncbi:hypothetical protein WH47_09864 [Habropoda laboriosa]|uniref:Uncharacterized protein n=1 Tax=Habropoda laboriosa TaxID=597456 RepID=A0A0L7R325_9HYME|nr:hypothetical protein WH47_09864 [Habropoda laboriosa]
MWMKKMIAVKRNQPKMLCCSGVRERPMGILVLISKTLLVNEIFLIESIKSTFLYKLFNA